MLELFLSTLSNCCHNMFHEDLCQSISVLSSSIHGEVRLLRYPLSCTHFYDENVVTTQSRTIPLLSTFDPQTAMRFVPSSSSLQYLTPFPSLCSVGKAGFRFVGFLYYEVKMEALGLVR